MNPDLDQTEPLLPKTPTNAVTFEPNDPEDPRNWSKVRKWLMVAAIVPIDLSVSWGASGFSPVASDFAKDMGVSSSVTVLGLSIPTGFVLFSFIAQGRSWHSVFRIMLVICLAFWVVMVTALYALGETRHSVILLRRARAMRTATGNGDLEVPNEMKQRGLKQLFSTALARPFRFLSTEAIVQFGALYNGFLYGLSFLFNGAFHMIFGPDGYGFDTVGVGISFLGIVLGITVGLATNIFQERYYQQRVSQAGNHDAPEARVHYAKLAAIVLPISLLAFALTATPNIHPFFAVFASAFWGWSFYTLILMTLTYTEDAYKTYSASALAGIGLIRNLAGAGFPLVGRHLFLNAGTRNASLVLMAIAICLAPIPFILEQRGASLRKRSPWAAAHEDEDESGDN
ncbi:MFS general substrate transporter [Stemphylium lycopersici]|nr:MFS general substrate transporter [Stemphylium lycopersici]